MLKDLPRVKFANLPTPLHEAEHLSKVMGGPKILLKRDDATGLVLGGQKIRMLEYEFGDALFKGCDVIVTTASDDANHTSQTLACANKLGMDTVLVFYKREQRELQGNGLLLNLLDPVVIETEFERGEEDAPKMNHKIDEIIDELRRKGRHPYKLYFKNGVYQPLGAVGFFYCAQEIMQQLKDMGETAQYVYVAHASGLSQGGLVLGAKYFQAPFKVVGTLTIPGDTKEERTENIVRNVNMASELLGAGITVDPGEILIHDEYIGPETLGAFGRATRKGIEAIRLVAKTEGIFLDPHYTGKAMSTLLDDIRQGKLTSKDNVIFYFTGGIPNIFSYTKELQIESRTRYEDM
jgi:1-aminocyclopropane-1-carboxylate deaminase/D-cysteine desulfhydrase-like pyridoxal-dependent ACC family enzyme